MTDFEANRMKQLELDVCENAEPRRGRKVYDQKIYVSALERGSRDRSPRPRQIEPLPDRIELKICPQKNHRGRMNYYRTRSIPELCRITLTPSGENSFQQDEMKEAYFTQYTHSFGQEIEKPHIVAWKRAFEDGDVTHKDSKLCMVNSPVGSKPSGYPERRKSAPPGSFVFNYDALDMPEPVHRRSTSLGLAMDSPLDFDHMDSQVGASAGEIMNTTTRESRTSGNKRTLAHETITAQKVEQVQFVDSSFWDDTFDSFNVEENHNNSTHNGVRNCDVTAMSDDDTAMSDDDTAMSDDDVMDGVTTGGVTTGGVTTDVFKRGDVTSDYSSQNGFNLRYGEITHDNDSTRTQDPTKQALSLISTLRSTVRKPDSKTFLRSVHETPKTDPESKNKNRSSMNNEAKEPSDQNISYRKKVPVGTPQKVTPRIVSIPRAEFTYHTVQPYEVLPRKSLRQETPRKNLPQESIPWKNEPQEDIPRVRNTRLGSQLNTESDPELKRKNTSKSEAMIDGYPPSKPNHGTSRPPSESRPDEKRKYETTLGRKKSEKIGNDTSHSPSELSTNDPVEIQSEESIPNFSSPPQANPMFSDQFNTEMSPKQVKTHQLTSATNATLKQGTIGMENQNRVYYRGQNVKVQTKKTVEITTSSHQVYDKRYNSRPAKNLTSKQGTADQGEGSHQKPNVDVRERKTVDTDQSNHLKPRSAESPTSEQETLDQDKDYYLEPNVEQRRKLDTNQSNYLEQIDDKNCNSQPQSKENPTSEQREHGEECKQQSAQVRRLKTFGNTVYSNSSKPTSSLSPNLEETDQNEDYYHLPNSEAGTLKTFENTIYSNGSKPTSRLSLEHEATNRNEDYYQSPNLEVRALKTVERKQSMSKDAENTVYKKPLKSAQNISPELDVTDQDPINEEYYQQPNSRMRTLKTVEINQSSHSKQVDNTVYSKHFTSNKTTDQLTPGEEEQYYQQPSPEVRQTEVRYRTVKNGEVRSNDSKFIYQTPERQTPKEDEPYYQQPTFQVKGKSVPENLYQEPEDSTLSSSKCPLDQHDHKDFKNQLPEIPQEQDSCENVYEIPKDTSPSSLKCPLDQKPEDRERSGDEQPHDHVYEQVDFSRKKIYEQHKYETMKPPQSRFYEQPNRNCYENFKVNTRPSHADVEYVAVTAPQRKNKTEEPVYEQPKTVFLSSLTQEGSTRNEVPARLGTAQVVNGIEDKNAKSTSYSAQAEVICSKNTGSKYKQTDTKHCSASSLRPTNEVEKDFKTNGPSTQVVYAGQSDKMKSVVSSMSSVRLDQSDGKISEGSPISRSASSEGDLLPQKPEVEVLTETPKMRERSKARQPQDEEFSQPSIYSKATQSKASQSNTSLARFSSFNSEASYKRRLTSAWIEQQRMNFRKQVSREPSLRRTKSVEFYKEQAPSEDTADYQLKHSKSELSFEQLSSMYNPFEDKYFEPNPNKHRAKVVHALPSEVFTKAIPSIEGIIASSEVKPRREPLTSNQKPKFRPKSADVSGFDVRTYNDEPRNFSTEENLERHSRMVTREVYNSGRPKVRPKSADVSGFDVRTYNDEPRNFSTEENLERHSRMVTREVYNSGRPKVRPKSADVSGFDVRTYNDETTLKHSKSEVSVDQLKAMYDPYDQNAWFSPDPVTLNDNQSDPRQVDVTRDEVVHRRTRSEPESRLDKLKNGRKQPESEIMKMKVEKVEAEPGKSVTKLDSQSVLVLNVVQPTESKNPKFQRNLARKSTGSIVSVRTKEIENEKRLTMAEMKDTQRESRRQNQTEDYTVGKTSQDGKPVEKIRAQYVIGGERSSVRYLSKSTHELTSNDATKKETSTQLQAQPMERPVKAAKKDSGFRNFFGKIRRAKSEPNLDKNFNILDIDSDHGGKLQRPENLKDDQQHFQETSPRNSQDKSQSVSKSGLKSWPFYPNFKNFKKNFSKSKQNKANGSFNDSGEDSARDMAKSQEFLESSVLSESDIKREKVQNLSVNSVKQDSRSMTVQTRSGIEPKLHEDKVGYVSSEKESKGEKSEEKTKRYRITEVTSRTITSSEKETMGGDENNSRFVDSFTRREDLTSTPNVNTTIANKNCTAFSTTSITVKQDNEENRTKMNVGLSEQRNSFHKNFLSELSSEQPKDKESEHKDATVNTYQERDSTNNGFESKHEELHTKEGKESKHRSFIGKKLFTSSGKSNPSQRRVENESSLEAGSSGEKEDITTVNTNQDSMNIGNSNGLENSKTVVRKKGRETTSKKNDKREREDKEKSEFGTRIKGFITKVLPQKDKNSTKDEIGKEETTAVKTNVEESERSPEERNNPATVVSVTSSSDERNVSDQREVASTTTKPRRPTFVVKHLGESESEKTRSSEDEGIQMKRGTVELDASNKHKQRTGYSSKVKHMGDSHSVETKNLEKLSVKQSSVDKRFTTLTNNERSIMQRDFQRNEVREMDSSESFKSRNTVRSNGLQDEIITKTNVVDNVEAFDPVLDFFENAFNDNEKREDDKSLSVSVRLGTPLKAGRPASNVMMTTSTMDAEKNFGVAGESESKTKRHEMQFGMGKETSDINERARSVEQIKGFTITQIKTSNVVLNESKEDLNTIDKDNQGDNIPTHLKQEELSTKLGYSRNTTTQITQGKISVDNEARKEPRQEDQKTTENPTRDVDQQQLKYVEKVMVSVHRGASEVERLVQDSTETSSIVESSCPVPKPLEHASSRNVDGNRNTKIVHTRGTAGQQATITYSSSKMGFENDPPSNNSSSPVSKPWQHVRSGSSEDDTKIVVTRDVPAKRLPPLNPEKNYVVTKQDKTQVANVNEGWGHVIEELVIKNTAETTNTLNRERNVVDGSKRTQLHEEQVSVETALKQLQPNESSNSLVSYGGGRSQTLSRSSSKSLEVVDRTDENKPLNIQEMGTFGTSRSEAMATGQLNSKTQTPPSMSNSLVKTTEVKPQSPSNSVLQTKSQTRTFSTNFEEQQRQSIERTITSLTQNNETVVGTKISRPKSLLYKNTKKNTPVVSTFHEKATKDMTVSTTPTEIQKYESKNEILNDVSKKNEKPKPPPVLPKPKRTKGKEISSVKIADARHEIIQQRKPVGFMDVQNNNHSFADFQSFQENFNGNAVEQTMFHASQRYQAGEVSRQRFVSSRVTDTERKNISSSATMKQLKNERSATSETFKQHKNRQDASENHMERNKEKSLNTSKQRKQRGTAGSETSEDLAVRLQRLLCEDDSMSEPEDSSVTHEISSAVYSFSEDSEFDKSLMDRRYKSLEKVRKIPGTVKIPKTSQISVDESSDEDLFRRNTKLSYKMHSKTL